MHGPIPTRDLMRRFGEEKARNIRLAGDLLDKIAQRQDVPRFFKVNKEDEKLQIAE